MPPVGRKTKKVLGNYIGRNEEMDMDESGDDESASQSFIRGMMMMMMLSLGQWHSQITA